MVVNDTDCHHSWNVTVMHCTDFNVAELKSLEYDKECGRYCTGTEIFIFICGLQMTAIVKVYCLFGLNFVFSLSC